MTQTNGDTAEDFARALGVVVIEVDGADECFTWNAYTRTAKVCADLCERRRQKGFDNLLRHL